MTKNIRSIPGLLHLLHRCSSEVQEHFKHLESLINKYPLEVALGYSFSRLELGQNMALYCGIVKVHRADSTVARNAINTHHMTRQSFMELYKTVYDIKLPEQAKKDLKIAEKTRDTVMHGGEATDERLRNAIGLVLEYAEKVNKQLDKDFQIKPFSGSLRGFAGRLKKLDKRTTRFMLKGMGFGIS